MLMHNADSVMETKRKTPDDDVIEVVDIADNEQPASAPLVNFKCPICMDTPDILVVTECGHLYCENCVFHALRSSRNSTKTSGQCSICRKPVKYSNVKYLEMRLAGQGNVKWKDKRSKGKRERKTEQDSQSKGSPETNLRDSLEPNQACLRASDAMQSETDQSNSHETVSSENDPRS